MSVGLYGDRLVQRFPSAMMETPRPAVVRSIERVDFAALRVSYDGICAERLHPTPPDEAFALVLRLTHQRAEIWLDGRASAKNPCRGQTSIYDLQSEIMVHFKDPFDFLYLYIPRQALIEVAEQEGAAGVNFGIAMGKSFADPIIAHLGECLLPALDDPCQANDLFVEYVTKALQTHFLSRYIGKSQPLREHRGGLTARQLRIAKQAIHANLDGSTSLNSIARECGLSPSHFARAFAISVGQPPHQWLLEQRVDLARQLLGKSTLPLAEIAIQCGFADQSHFTRIFSARAGLSPGRWRRVRQL
jgi:AraC family transcriptional regulator